MKIKSAIKKKRSRPFRISLRALKRNLKQHVDTLATEIGERNSQKYAALEQTYLYILSSMQQTAFDISSHEYLHEHKHYQIVISEKVGMEKPDEIIIIGAHYDTAEGTPGADDNATGIATLLECNRVLDTYNNSRTIRFVAFPNEEPPFHDSPLMGSKIYAKQCAARNENISCMIALEMLGYYSDKRGSQRYPTTVMEQKLTNRGNFVAIVGNVKSRSIVKSLSLSFDEPHLLPIEPMVTYEYTPGANLSDHAPFWEQGYKAIMITDTAFYRNPHYHLPDDEARTINYGEFAKVTYCLINALQKLDQQPII